MPMRPITEMARAMWWTFAVAGVGAFVAALVAGPELAFSANRTLGAWAVVAGLVIIVGAFRAPGGFARAAPFLPAGAAGILLGLVLVVLPSSEVRVGAIAVGIWGMVAGSGFLAVARVARAFRVPDGNLFETAWVEIAAGMAIVALAGFGLAVSTYSAAISVAIVGAITLFASARLRVLPFEAPVQPSKRELERRQRDERPDRRP